MKIITKLVKGEVLSKYDVEHLGEIWSQLLDTWYGQKHSNNETISRYTNSLETVRQTVSGQSRW